MFKTDKEITSKIETLKQENKELREILNYKIEATVKKIEQLEQDKIYYIVEKSNPELFENYLRAFEKKIMWTMPNIIIINKEIKELDKSELKELFNKVMV